MDGSIYQRGRRGERCRPVHCRTFILEHACLRSIARTQASPTLLCLFRLATRIPIWTIEWQLLLSSKTERLRQGKDLRLKSQRGEKKGPLLSESMAAMKNESRMSRCIKFGSSARLRSKGCDSCNSFGKRFILPHITMWL